MIPLSKADSFGVGIGGLRGHPIKVALNRLISRIKPRGSTD